MKNTYTVIEVSCDRCHKEMSTDFANYAAIILDNDIKCEMDLCESCYNVLEDFRWGRNVGDKK